MIYIEIPYSNENNRIDKDYAKKELRLLRISDDEKHNVFEAIYKRRPRSVNFDDKDAEKVSGLEKTLEKLGVGYRRTTETVY